MPPPWRNHRDPTGPDTPTAVAASSLETPVAISRQNLRSTSRGGEGRPGDRIAGRPVCCAVRPVGHAIDHTSIIEVLRRPRESAGRASVGVEDDPLRLVLNQIAFLPPRVATAIFIAAHASSASGCNDVAAPSRRREYRSITVARYNFGPRPSGPVGISVMSPTHLAFGRSAVKSRLSRSGNLGAVLSCLVNPFRRLIRRATKPWRRIESATVFSLTFQPTARRSWTNRGEPCNPRALPNAIRTARSMVSRRRSLGVCRPLTAPGPWARPSHL